MQTLTASKTFKESIWVNNPIASQMLGICSALAVTTKLENAIVMSIALTVVTMGSSFSVSILRKLIPSKVRMIAEVSIIATFVILFDQYLKAFMYPMSQQLGPYVGLIITNCIVMGRAEAFALKYNPGLALVDGLSNGLGYAVVLMSIGAVRELLGFGTILGMQIMPAGFEACQIMVLAPGAFFLLAAFVWIRNAITPVNEGAN